MSETVGQPNERIIRVNLYVRSVNKREPVLDLLKSRFNRPSLCMAISTTLPPLIYLLIHAHLLPAIMSALPASLKYLPLNSRSPLRAHQFLRRSPNRSRCSVFPCLSPRPSSPTPHSSSSSFDPRQSDRQPRRMATGFGVLGAYVVIPIAGSLGAPSYDPSASLPPRLSAVDNRFLSFSFQSAHHHRHRPVTLIDHSDRPK